MTLVAPILHFATTRRDAPALIDGGRTLTYGRLGELVLRSASHLAVRGLRPGDRVGLCLGDTAEHIVALLAVAHLGAVGVSLDWRAPAAETARLTAGLGLAATLAEPGARLTRCGALMVLDADWRGAVAGAPIVADMGGGWDDPFAISATSGSTGQPKLTQMTHRQYYFAVAGMLELMDLSGRHRFLCTMPLYYSGGRNSCLAHLLRGDCVVLYPSLFSPDEYVEVVGRQEITVAGLVPSMVRQLLNAYPDQPLEMPRLTKLFCTGAPLYAEEKRQAARILSPHFHERYGAAETLVISMLRPEDFADRADSVGQPHSLADISIVDEHDRPLPPGETGLLRYRGPGLATPLAGNASAAHFRNGGFFPGEIARMDQAGYIFLEGRTSEVIVRNGAKVYPAEVEATLLEHPGVAEAAVLGVASAGAEEIVVAFVATRGQVSHGELLAHCRGRLTPHKVPRVINFVPELPKTTAGKTDRQALAAVARARDGRAFG